MLLPILLVICKGLNMRALTIQVMANASCPPPWTEGAKASRSPPQDSNEASVVEEPNALSAQLPQNLAALHSRDPERGQDHRGMSRHIRAANESVSMQALFPTDTHSPTVTLPSSANTTLSQSMNPSDLQWLGERLRVACGPVEAPLPARLAELVERLTRHETPKGNVRA
jgi:hypothetical protein